MTEVLAFLLFLGHELAHMWFGNLVNIFSFLPINPLHFYVNKPEKRFFHPPVDSPRLCLITRVKKGKSLPSP